MVKSSEKRDNMKKMKERLDAFSDAIIAIIITIMVLELPDVINNTSAEYVALARAVMIYLVSFCFIATLWVRYASMFNAVETIDNKVLVLNLIFLAILSLTPLATKTIYSDITNYNVMGYGVLMILLQIIILALEYAITGCQQEWQQELVAMFRRLHRFRSFYTIGVNVVLILIAYHHPQIAVILYFIYIIFCFVITTLNRTEFQEIETLNIPEQETLVNLDGKELQIARRQMIEQMQQARGAARDQLKAQKADVRAKRRAVSDARKERMEAFRHEERRMRQTRRDEHTDQKRAAHNMREERKQQFRHDDRQAKREKQDERDDEE